MSSHPLQVFSHYPAIPPPVPVRLWESPGQDCPYLPGRRATMRAILTRDIPAETYRAFMDANFRRSGNLIYQPTCPGCRMCQSIRVLTREHRMSKSQRRCWRRNQDLVVSVGAPSPTAEKFAVYQEYLSRWHDREPGSHEEFCSFLYESPVPSLEFTYRDSTGKLLAVGICDHSLQSLSSVYFYFDPSECSRSLGTFGALWEIRWAAQNGVPYYYLGYWVPGCGAMEYKASFHPHHILGMDGVWRDPDKNESRHVTP